VRPRAARTPAGRRPPHGSGLTPGCPANPLQCDSDANLCDGDLNNNGASNAQDSVLFRQQPGQPSVPAGLNEADINCNGAVNAQDTTLFRQLLGSPRGPSGLQP
jgi:hypothetical protein